MGRTCHPQRLNYGLGCRKVSCLWVSAAAASAHKRGTCGGVGGTECPPPDLQLGHFAVYCDSLLTPTFELFPVSLEALGSRAPGTRRPAVLLRVDNDHRGEHRGAGVGATPAASSHLMPDALTSAH